MAVDPYIGEISIVAFDYAPPGWLPCDGRLLQINENQALFALIGNRYGGNQSQKTFALPDLRGRIPLGVGLGPTLTPRTLGQQGGAEQMALKTAQLPAHVHSVVAHSHTMPHAHALTAHSHLMPHNHSVGSHNHSMPHTHDLASHTHTTTHGHGMNASGSIDNNEPTGHFPSAIFVSAGTAKAFGNAAGKVMNSGVVAQDSTPSGGPSVANTGASSTPNTGDANGGNTGDPSSASTGNAGSGTTGDCSANTGATALNSDPTGAGAKVDIVAPFLCLNFIIAVQGIFPTRGD